jgi:hypothetical protein
MKDTFRKKYKPLFDGNAKNIELIKEKAEELLEMFCNYPSSREMSLAITNLEQSIMWCTKSICLHDEAAKESHVSAHTSE